VVRDTQAEEEATVKQLFFSIVILALVLPLVTAQNFTTADAGNVTMLNISFKRLTDHWQGFFGQIIIGTNVSGPTVLNATGSRVNESGIAPGNVFLQVNCNNPNISGMIFLSNSTEPPTGIVPGNLSVLDILTGNMSDSGTNTFTGTSTFNVSGSLIAGVPTAYSFVNSTAQNLSFREGFFMKGNTLVFGTIIENNTLSFNESLVDYQIMVLAPNRTTVPYYLFFDLVITCPPQIVTVIGGGGGGSGGGGCRVNWNCTRWGPCSLLGLQSRTCFEINRCPPPYIKPPTVRTCTPGEPVPPFEQPVLISEADILTPSFLRNLELKTEPAKGMILTPIPIKSVFINKNSLSVEDVHIEVTTPAMLVAPVPAQPYPQWLTDAGIGGWSDHGAPEPKTLSWKVSDLPAYERLDPQSTTWLSLDVTPPVMLPKLVDVGLDVLSGPVKVATGRVPVTVDVPEFAIAGVTNDNGIMTVYAVIDNRGKEEKDINIEIALNRRKSTLAAELFGPLRVAADKVAIFGHEYRLTRAAETADRLAARLVSAEGVQRAEYALR